MDRIAKDSEFHYINEDMKMLRQKLDLNQLSLNEKIRMEELADDKKRKEARNVARKQNLAPASAAYEGLSRYSG